MKAQEEGDLGPQGCRKDGPPGEQSGWAKVRLGEEQEGPWHTRGQHSATWGGSRFHRATGPSSDQQGPNLPSRPRSLGATGHVEQENRSIGPCFGKNLLEVVLIPQEGKKSERRGPFQRVACP